MIPVAWGEQDLFGHVNNIVYFRYFESVRMHFLDRIGVLRSYDQEGIGVILASTTCDYLKPIEWPGAITVRTGCDRIGTTSFTMVYQITNAAGELIAKGSSVQVMYDYNKATKVPVPQEVRMAIEELQAI